MTGKSKEFTNTEAVARLFARAAAGFRGEPVPLMADAAQELAAKAPEVRENRKEPEEGGSDDA